MLVATFILAPTGEAFAQSTPDACEALIQRGLRLRKAGDDAGALPEFQKAYELAHTPRAAAQLGFVEQALARWDDADLHLTEAVRTTGDSWIEKNRAALEKSLTSVKEHVASLQITGEPENAEVYINGRRIGTLPIGRPVSVIAGDVDVELRADGYKRSTQKISIAAYQYRPLVVRLEKLGGAPSAAVSARTSPLPPVPGTGNQSPEATVRATPPSESAPFAVQEATGPVHRSARAVVGWSLAGAGFATATVGAVVALLGQAKMNEANADVDRANAAMDEVLYMNAAGKFSSGSSQRTTGWVLLVVGGVVSAGGAAWALTSPRSDTGSTVARIGPVLETHNGRLISSGLSWSGTW